MCGIIYVRRKDGRPACKSVLKRYYKQRNRGTDGFGYVAIKDGKVVSYKRSPIEHEIINALRQESATEILFHHRFPTSIPNIEEGAHPLYINHIDPEQLKYQYFIAHNGVIRNDEELKKEHEKKGFRYRTEILRKFVTFQGKEFDVEPSWNDSEALAVETALALDGKQEDIGSKGTAAVVALQLDGDTVIARYFYRNTMNPLNHYDNDVMTILSSEGAGTAVDHIRVQVLRDDGKLIDDERRIFSPNSWSYENTNNYTGYRGPNYADKDDKDDKDDKNKTTTLSLPAGQRKGFLGDEGIEEYTDDEVRETEVIPAEPIEVMHISEQLKDLGARFINYMTDDVLWAEFDRVLGLEEEVNRGLDMFTQKIMDIGYDDEILASHDELTTAIGKIIQYRKNIEDEINKRESGVLLVRSL